MGRFGAALLTLIAAFAGAYLTGKHHLNLLIQRSISPHFTPAAYPHTDRPFVLFISGRNNGAHIEKSLRSLFTQKYHNFRIIYIDDASDDGSFSLVQSLIYEWGHLDKATLLQNEQPLGELANLARAVNQSFDDEIIVPITSGDWLAHEWVLSRLNQYYANDNLWLTESASRTYPLYSQNGRLPLKTFYAKLLKNHGPTLNIDPHHSCKLDEIHYIYNQEAP